MVFTEKFVPVSFSLVTEYGVFTNTDEVGFL
jgi:hypothetical protein